MTILDFLPQECRNDIQKGLEENKKKLEEKIMATKDIMQETDQTDED